MKPPKLHLIAPSLLMLAGTAAPGVVPGGSAVNVIFGATGATISAYAGDNGFDLMIMGTRGRTGLSHLLMGSVAESVIRTAPCPVLTVKSVHADKAQPATTEPASVAV